MTWVALAFKVLIAIAGVWAAYYATKRQQGEVDDANKEIDRWANRPRDPAATSILLRQRADRKRKSAAETESQKSP